MLTAGSAEVLLENVFAKIVLCFAEVSYPEPWHRHLETKTESSPNPFESSPPGKFFKGHYVPEA